MLFRTLATRSIGAFANNLFKCHFVVKEEDERRCIVVKHKPGWPDLERIKLVGLLVCFEPTSQKKKSKIFFYFPILIRMPGGAKLPIFLDYLYSHKNKLIKT